MFDYGSLDQVPDFAPRSQYANNYHIKKVIIENGVTSIGKHAFSECKSLGSEVSLPDSLTDIREYAFFNCGLYDLTIPASVRQIRESAFDRCYSLRSVTFEDGLISIGTHAFYGCENVKSLTFPDTLTSIGDFAFSKCTQINRNHHSRKCGGSRYTSLSCNCYRLKQIKVAAGNPAYCNENDAVLSKKGQKNACGISAGCNGST